MFAQLTRRVETGPLNQALEKWLEDYPPPIGPRTRFKIRYATQTSANPVKFMFFVSRPEAIGEPYVAYLRNRIRKDLGYSMIPIEIELRGSRKDPITARKEMEDKRVAAKKAAAEEGLPAPSAEKRKTGSALGGGQKARVSRRSAPGRKKGGR
jgi:GTP-binding protein